MKFLKFFILFYNLLIVINLTLALNEINNKTINGEFIYLFIYLLTNLFKCFIIKFF